MTIYLDPSLPTASSNLPEFQLTRVTLGPFRRNSAWSCTGWGLPCHSCHQKCGELLPRHFTLTCIAASGIFSVALSVALLRLDVIQHPTLRCPDFPPVFNRRPSATHFKGSNRILLLQSPQKKIFAFVYFHT